MFVLPIERACLRRALISEVTKAIELVALAVAFGLLLEEQSEILDLICKLVYATFHGI